MKSKKDRKEYLKTHYQAHRDDILAKQKAHYQAHRDEIKAKQKAYREAHKVERMAYRESHKAEAKAYREAHRDETIAYINAYKKADTNSNGVSKDSIRCRSRYYLFNVLKHTKLDGYEIHHCFGYDDYKCFIYIPKELHLKIHQYLRDNGISADTDHYSKIAHLVVAWEGYVYIKD